jgi:hypothetical protein
MLANEERCGQCAAEVVEPSAKLERRVSCRLAVADPRTRNAPVRARRTRFLPHAGGYCAE